MSGLRVSLDQLDLDEEEIYQNARYQGKPFTGTACGEEGQEVYEIPYENGSAHGRCVWRYKKSGKLSTEDFVEHGTIIKSTSWYSPGDVVGPKTVPGSIIHPAHSRMSVSPKRVGRRVTPGTGRTACGRCAGIWRRGSAFRRTLRLRTTTVISARTF